MFYNFLFNGFNCGIIPGSVNPVIKSNVKFINKEIIVNIPINFESNFLKYKN